MVWTNDSEFTRSSICFARRDRNGYIDCLERILDYRRDINGVGSYQWVYGTGEKSRQKNPDNPKTLYRRETVEQLHDPGEDFLYVKWKPNAVRPERPIIKDLYRRAYDFTPEFYEVIDCPTDSLEGLRNHLKSGWFYSGNPTRQVLVLYAGKGDLYEAVLLDRNSLDFSKDRIRLKPSAPLGAERYIISRHDIEKLPSSFSNNICDRVIYEKPFLPKTKGMVLVQPLQRYVLRYMRWYVDTIQAVESAQEQQRFESMLSEAFQTPEHLVEFGIYLSPSDMQQLRKTITRFVDDDNQMVPLVNDMLSKNPAFHRECVNACRQELQGELSEEREAMKAELEADLIAKREGIERQIQQKLDTVRQMEEKIRSRSESYENLRKLVNPLQEQVDDMNRQLDQAKADLKQINDQADADLAEFEKLRDAELRKLEEQREETLARLENDAALKLGLNAMVQSLEATFAALPIKTTAETTTTPTSCAINYPAIPVRQGTENFADTLADNLQAFGVISVDDSSASPRSLAKAFERSLSATRLIAVDSAFAAPFANALSYTGNGRPAKHACIPADWHDASALDDMLSDEDTDVLVLDGPIDTVNESLLFALSRLDLDTTVILPIGAYGNLRLIAGEIWNHVFYLSTERYVRLPLTPKQLFRSGKNRTTIPTDTQKLIGVLSGLHMQAAGMPYSSLVLPAAVSARFDRSEDGESWIAPHLALRAHADSGTDALKPSIVSGNDAAKRLMERIGRSRHAR